MITIIHGDDTKASRSDYITLKQNHPSQVVLDGASFNLTDLLEALTGDGLFDENKSVFIEQFLSKRKKSKVLDELVDTLVKNADKEIFLWENKEIDKKMLSKFSKATIHTHKLPQILFTFLDSLKPGNSRVLIPLFHQALQTSEEEVLFAMLVRQLRILLALSDSNDNPIDEVKRLAPWQHQKLKKQALLFSREQLITHYNSLFEIDYAQKTGKLSMPLDSTIDFWLLRL